MLNKFKIQLESKGEIYLKVKVHPGAGKTEITDIMEDNTIKIDVAASPVKGKANQELIKFLAKEFEINKNNVKIISGFKDRVKLISITRNS